MVDYNSTTEALSSQLILAKVLLFTTNYGPLVGNPKASSQGIPDWGMAWGMANGNLYLSGEVPKEYTSIVQNNVCIAAYGLVQNTEGVFGLQFNPRQYDIQVCNFYAPAPTPPPPQ